MDIFVCTVRVYHKGAGSGIRQRYFECPALPQTSCMTSDSYLNLSLFLQLSSRNNSIYLIGLGRITGIMYMFPIYPGTL